MPKPSYSSAKVNFQAPEVVTFHTTGYGWNYFTQTTKDGTKFRTGRYFTNGHVNMNTQVSYWYEGTAPATEAETRYHFEINC